jgi:hypothetical protein
MRKNAGPQTCVKPANASRWYLYSTELRDTAYGPERWIRLSRDGEWYDGLCIELQECMSEDAIVAMAIRQLEG